MTFIKVIMDEVGRGTTVKDGLSIAFAAVHHMYHVNRCRALFATHFHELVDMLGFSEDTSASQLFPGIKFSCTEVEEDEVSSFISVVKGFSDSLQSGRFSYSHRMKAGVNRDSHGLKVAQLAGMPPSALKVAEEVLSFMKAPRGKKSQGGMNAMLADLGRRFASPDPAARR